VIADVDIDQTLAVVSAALNDRQLKHYDTELVQELVTAACGAERKLTVDDGGGLHEQSGVRIGAIRKTSSGEWIIDRQNPRAAHADARIPARAPESSSQEDASADQ
jgi:hypothetical protein